MSRRREKTAYFGILIKLILAEDNSDNDAVAVVENLGRSVVVMR
jgi:hypothetical protein